MQVGHLSRKHGTPGNVGEFDHCLGSVRKWTKSQGSINEKNLIRENFLTAFIFAACHYLIRIMHACLLSCLMTYVTRTWVGVTQSHPNVGNFTMPGVVSL